MTSLHHPRYLEPVSRNPANTPAASEDARNVIYAIPLEGSAASSLRSSHGGARRDVVCNLAYEYTPAASDGAPNVVYAIAGGVHKSSNQPQNTISSQHYVDDGFYKLTENNTPSPRTATGEASPVYAIPFEGSSAPCSNAEYLEPAVVGADYEYGHMVLAATSTGSSNPANDGGGYATPNGDYASAEESRSKVAGVPAVPADDGGGYARPNGDYVATTVHSAESKVFKVGNSSAAAATITAAPAGGDSDVVYAVPLMRPAAKALLDADGYVQDTLLSTTSQRCSQGQVHPWYRRKGWVTAVYKIIITRCRRYRRKGWVTAVCKIIITHCRTIQLIGWCQRLRKGMLLLVSLQRQCQAELC